MSSLPSLSLNGIATLFFVLMSIDVKEVSASSKYFLFCDISSRPIVPLKLNKITGEYQLSDHGARRLDDLGFQANQAFPMEANFDIEASDYAFRLSSGKADSGFEAKAYRPSSSRRLDFTPPERTTGRMCSCSMASMGDSTRYYCQSDRSFCAVPADYYSQSQTGNPNPPVCLNLQNDEIFVRSVWPIILIWFGLSSLFCICTVPGRNAVDYVISTFFPYWNSFILNRMTTRRPAQAIELVRRRQYRRQREIESRLRRWEAEEEVPESEGVEVAPVTSWGRPRRIMAEYQLKTSIYREPAQNVNDEEYAPGSSSSETVPDHQEYDEDGNAISSSHASCSICLAPLCDGDRVGKLPCRHLFHIDCLKGWLKRRNVCPLCMQANIATPRVPLWDGAEPSFELGDA